MSVFLPLKLMTSFVSYTNKTFLLYQKRRLVIYVNVKMKYLLTKFYVLAFLVNLSQNRDLN